MHYMLRGTVYVSDDYKITCSEPTCKCEDGEIEFPGRRMELIELIEAIERHWRKYGTD